MKDLQGVQSMQRARLNLLLLLFIGVFSSGCGGNLFATSTVTITPTLTSTHTPPPTTTSTPTKTPRPTRTPIPPSPTLELPKSTPLAEWSGIPIMPNAIAGESGEPYYLYITEASPEEVLQYYFETLPKYGWEFVDTLSEDNVKQIYAISNNSEYTLYLGFGYGFILIREENGLTHVDIFYRVP